MPALVQLTKGVLREEQKMSRTIKITDDGKVTQEVCEFIEEVTPCTMGEELPCLTNHDLHCGAYIDPDEGRCAKGHSAA